VPATRRKEGLIEMVGLEKEGGVKRKEVKEKVQKTKQTNKKLKPSKAPHMAPVCPFTLLPFL